ncbi:MAG: hypothetical protein EOO13_11795 [Chitinophagaceae bacterium]|nr:MAG: hypothetical protein EOO13_11795 [Chitinophagaceae bacterium]
MQFRTIIMALFIFLPASLLAQEKDITGLWKGTLFNDTTQKFYKYEIGISKEKGKYTGFSHTWFLIGDTQYFGVKKVAIRVADDGKILVEDNGLIANNYPIAPNKGVRQLNVLTLNATDSIMTLTGPFSTNRTKDYHSLTGSISLQRKNDFWQSALVPHLQELGKDDELSFVKEEKQLLAKADAAERDLQLAIRNTSIANEKEKAEKDRQDLLTAKKADTENERIAKATAKQEAGQKAAEQKALAKADIDKEREAKRIATEKEKADKLLSKEELAKQTAAEKETARIAALKEKNDKIIAAEKEKADKLLSKEELAKQTAAAKESARIAALDKKNDKIVAAEREKQDKILAKEEAAKTAAIERNIKQSKKQPAEMVKNDPADSKAMPAFKTNKEPAAEVNSRKTIIQQVVNFSSDSLQLSLYDNGEIDGDTVSVLMNGQLILAKQGLGIRAIKHTIYIPHNVDKVEMVMYAETLGSIPPNTGLLVIRDGKDLYEIRFSGDLQKNASIVFNRRKE